MSEEGEAQSEAGSEGAAHGQQALGHLVGPHALRWSGPG